MRDFDGKHISQLTKHVLGEVPEQLLSFMKDNGHSPLEPLKFAPPPFGQEQPLMGSAPPPFDVGGTTTTTTSTILAPSGSVPPPSGSVPPPSGSVPPPSG